MNGCLYEPIHGEYPKCNGACKRGKNNYCSYYYVDKIWEIIYDWKKEAGVTSAILWKYDTKRNKMCLYTTKPGYFIGLRGNLYQKYFSMLQELNNDYVKNGIDFIECDEFMNGD